MLFSIMSFSYDLCVKRLCYKTFKCPLLCGLGQLDFKITGHVFMKTEVNGVFRNCDETYKC